MGRENEFIMFDWAMKHMLRDKSNFEILEGLISVLLGQDIKIKEILESESNQVDDSDKFNRVDIKAVNSQGHIIIVEVQVFSKYRLIQRVPFGSNRGMLNLLKNNDRNGRIKRGYLISLIYDHFGEGPECIYHGEAEFDTLVFCNVPFEYYILRVYDFAKTPTSPIEEWMLYLKSAEVCENTSTPGLQHVREKLRVSSMSKAQWNSYFRYLDNLMQQNDEVDTAYSEGIVRGFIEGFVESFVKALGEDSEKTRLLASRILLKRGYPSELLSTLLGIPKVAIENIT